MSITKDRDHADGYVWAMNNIPLFRAAHKALKDLQTSAWAALT